MTETEPPATLADWRMPGRSVAAFRRVREIVPSAEIAAGDPAPLPRGAMRDPGRVPVPDGRGGEAPLGALLRRHRATGFVALRDGALVGEWYDLGYDGRAPHILFSVSKSLTGLLAGILAGRGDLDTAAPVTRYLPEVAGSAYEGATVEHVLDMTVSTDFEESYLDIGGDYERYRIATAWNPAPDAGRAEDLHPFLATMRPGGGPHGARVHYVSPNSDLLGWLLERAGGRRYAELLSDLLWRPVGAERAAYVTVDRRGAARAAGGVCAIPRDLARVGEMVRLRGVARGAPVVPGWWIDSLFAGGDRAAWARGDMAGLFPSGSYRRQWYATGLASGALAALGIHGQWLWIDPERGVVLALVSAQPRPMDDAVDQEIIAALDALSAALA